MDSQTRLLLEEKLLELPVVQYAWMKPEDIEFSEKVRYICRTECPRYGTSWSCPPAVGTVEECRSRCEAYDGVFVFTTIAEVNDAANMEETLATRAGHEAVTREIQDIFEMSDKKHKAGSRSPLALSAESCATCRKCAYPDAPCRHPEQMLPCIESYGIVVPKLAEKAGIEFMTGAKVVTWFGIVLFTE
ncbi:MAG: DUF2284 domain-containing protein [Lachnospiraceae bacterium]|nr:DUF2284 domain-containing protein [Lachnospiraceae bacterium]